MAFSTTNAVVLTGAIVVAGYWANGRKLTIRLAIGGAVLMFGLAALNEADPNLASKFAVLIVVAALFMYGPGIAKKTGLTK